MWHHLCAMITRARPNWRTAARRTALRVEALGERLVPATFTVTTRADTLADDGRLSLREAITRANERPGADTVVVRAWGPRGITCRASATVR